MSGDHSIDVNVPTSVVFTDCVIHTSLGPVCEECGTTDELIEFALEQPEGAPTGETIWLCVSCYEAT